MNEVNLLGDLLYVAREIAFAVIPLTLIFMIFQFSFLQMPREYFLDTLKGIALAAAGLFLFLYGVFIGFLPAGWNIGHYLVARGMRWVLLPIGFVLGLLAIFAEPAVRVLGEEVEEQSSGYLKKSMIVASISLGVACIVALAMARVILGISIYWFIVPGYAVLFLMLIIFKPPLSSLAFDSGGVATGPITVSFIMAIAVGAAESLGGGGNIGQGFGLVALVAMAPTVSIMALSLVLKRKGGTDD